MTLSDPRSASAEQPARGRLRTLEPADLPELRALLTTDPDAYCVVSERVEAGGLDPAASGGPTWGWFTPAGLRSAVYVGPNLIPVEATAEANVAFADRLRRLGRRSSAVVGYREQALHLWELIAPTWGPAREVRADQPLLVTAEDPQIEPDPAVRPAGPRDLDLVLPAAIAMFEEEVGISPVTGGRAPAYRARVAQMIRLGRTYVHIDAGEVLFKAEIGAVSTASCQLQGVWLTPRLRGVGASEPAIAAVVAAARRDHAARVSLYANAHNVAALRAYRRVGFRQIGTFSTVLF